MIGETPNLYQRLYRKIRSLYLTRRFHSCHSSVRFNGICQLCGTRYIIIDRDTVFGTGLFLTVWQEHLVGENPIKIRIGKDCSFGAFNHISAINNIVIGDGFLSGKWVSIIDNSHGNTDYQTLMINPLKRKIVSKGPIIIGKNVWVGDKVTILPGVSIGDGVVIGSNSVVTRDIPPYCVVGGIPAKIIKQNKILKNE